jgi:hypothetical protein
MPHRPPKPPSRGGPRGRSPAKGGRRSAAGRALFFRVAGTTSAGRFRYSRRYSMPSLVRNLW